MEPVVCCKQIYNSKREAQEAKNRILRSHKIRDKPTNLRVYACDVCSNKWHLTTVRKTVKHPKLGLSEPETNYDDF